MQATTDLRPPQFMNVVELRCWKRFTAENDCRRMPNIACGGSGVSWSSTSGFISFKIFFSIFFRNQNLKTYSNLLPLKMISKKRAKKKQILFRFRE